MTTDEVVILVVAILGVLHGPLTPYIIALFTRSKGAK